MSYDCETCGADITGMDGVICQCICSITLGDLLEISKANNVSFKEGQKRLIEFRDKHRLDDALTLKVFRIAKEIRW